MPIIPHTAMWCAPLELTCTHAAPPQGLSMALGKLQIGNTPALVTAPPVQPGLDPADLASVLMRDFPTASRRMQSPPSMEAATAWPLPGAAAGRRKGPPKRPRGPVVGNNTPQAGKAGPASQIRRTSTFTVHGRGNGRRVSTVLREGSGQPPGEAKSAPRVAAADQAISANRETLFSPMSKAAVFKKEPEPDPRPPPIKFVPSAAPAGVPAAAGGAQTGQEAAPAAVATPQCIRFPGQQQLRRHIDKAGHHDRPLTYCVRPTDLPIVEQAILEARHDDREQGRWLAVALVTDHHQRGQTHMYIHKRHGLGPYPQAASHPPVRLGKLDIVTLLRTRLIGVRAAQRFTLPDEALLERNTFRVLKHAEASGAERLFIAYVVTEDTASGDSLGVGYQEIFTDRRGRYDVEDTASGFVLSAESLDDLIEGLEVTTGCRFLAMDEDSSEAGSDEHARHSAQPARNLFVERSEVHASRPPFPLLQPSAQASFFRPVSVQLDDGSRQGLYRSTFITTANGVAYVDRGGRAGSLYLVPRPSTGERFTLRGRHPQDVELIQRLGLIEGAPCTLQMLVDALRGGRMLHLQSTPPADTAQPHHQRHHQHAPHPG